MFNQMPKNISSYTITIPYETSSTQNPTPLSSNKTSDVCALMFFENLPTKFPLAISKTQIPWIHLHLNTHTRIVTATAPELLVFIISINLCVCGATELIFAKVWMRKLISFP